MKYIYFTSRLVLWLANIFSLVHCVCSQLRKVTLKLHGPAIQETKQLCSVLPRSSDSLKVGVKKMQDYKVKGP